MRRKLPTIIGGLKSSRIELTPKTCDALVSAYTAFLYLKGKTKSFGNATEGFIIVPDIGYLITMR